MASKNFSANLKIGAMMGSSVGRVFGGLKSKLKEQETTLKGLRAAYKEAAKGTGEYAGRLDDLQREIDQTETKLKRMREAAKFDFKGVGSTMLGDMKRLAIGAGVAAGAIAAVGGSIFALTKDFVDWADDIGDAAEALGMSTQALQTWQFAAATVGVGGDKMTASIARFSKAISEGGTATVDTMSKLGVNAARLKKLGLDEQLEIVAEAFKDYKGADKAALAMKLFGKSGYQLAGILAKGKKGLDEFREAGEKTGAVLNDDAAKAAGDAASALDMFGITMVGLRNTIAIQFVPVLQRLAERFTQFASDNGPKIREWATRFGELIETKVVPALGRFLDKLPAIIESIGEFGTKVFRVADALQNFLGGWDNLGIALIALNFLPTIAAVGKLSAALWVLTGATWAAVAPIALVGVAIAGIGLFIASVIDPGGPLDLLGKLFPETMEKIRVSIQAVGEYIEDKIDAAIGKLQELLNWFGKLTGIGDFFSGTAGPSAAPNYDIPRAPASILGVMPKGERSPLTLPQPDAPPATKEDLLEFIKPQASNSTYNINVNAPGSNGDDIADRIRRAFERKPLFDSDGALVPG